MKKIVLSLVTILALTIGILPFLTKEPITANAEETESTLIKDDGWFYDEDYEGLDESSNLIFRVYHDHYGGTYYYTDISGVSELIESSTTVFKCIEENGVVTQCGLHLLQEKDTFAAGTKFYIRINGKEELNNTIYYKFLNAENDIITLKLRTDKGVTSISYNSNSFKINNCFCNVKQSTNARLGAFWAIENTQSLKVLSITSDSIQGNTYGYAVMSSYEEVGNVAPALRTFKDFEDGFLTKANKWVNNTFNVNLTGPVFGTLFIGLIVLLVVRRGRR